MKQADIIRLMKAGWRLEERTNFNGKKILGYWLGKRGERNELIVSKKLRDTMVEKGLITTNNELI